MSVNELESSCETEQSCCSSGSYRRPQNGTIKYDDRMIGRSEPCHCGSNRKFKKCCDKKA